ncbi:MAG: hypothetical protein ACKVOQ_08895 [Cyclobacteriaceae bacterium]
MKPRNPYTPENRAETNYYKLGGYAFFRMKQYLNSMKDLLQTQKYRLQENYKEEIKKYPQYSQMIDGVYEERYRELDVHFNRIMLNSSFIASFSIFEIMFKEVCHLAAYKYSRSAELDFSSGIIDHYRSYIVKDLRIDISDLKQYWKKLIQYRELRNHLIHHGSNIQKNPDNIIGFIRKLDSIKVKKIRNKDQYKFVLTDKQFIIEFLDTASEFLANILLKLPKGKRKSLPHIKK